MKKGSAKSQGEGKGGGAEWLTTFNDLMTLLMVFFVLLFTMGTTDTKKLKSFKGSLQSGLGVLEAGTKATVKVMEGKHETESEVGDEVDGVDHRQVEKEFIGNLNRQEGINAVRTEKGVVITLEDAILFGSGQAEINTEASPVLDRITEVINKIPNRIRVEGHTDNDPIHTERYDSNWELSTARAVNVVKWFVSMREISPERFSAAGYGEVKPLVLNDTAEHKARNRRVEIILVKEGER